MKNSDIASLIGDRAWAQYGEAERMANMADTPAARLFLLNYDGHTGRLNSAITKGHIGEILDHLTMAAHECAVVSAAYYATL